MISSAENNAEYLQHVLSCIPTSAAVQIFDHPADVHGKAEQAEHAVQELLTDTRECGPEVQEQDTPPVIQNT